MLKSRVMFGVIAIVMILAFAQSSYSQLSITVTGNPSPRETATSRTAETNDPNVETGLVIAGTVLSDAPITGGRLRITYPADVTNNTAFPGGAGCVPDGSDGDTCDPIRVSFASGIFEGATVGAVDNNDGRVDIRLPCLVGPGITGDTGTIILTGVRIDATQIAAAPASASISNVAGAGIVGDGPGGIDSVCPTSSVTPANVSVGTASVEVITTLPAGIGSVANGGMPSSVDSEDIEDDGGTPLGVEEGTCPGVDDAHASCGVATLYTSRNAPDQFATFTVTEGHRTAWFNGDPGDDDDGPQFTGARGFVNDAGFRLTFNGLPTGVTLTVEIAAFTSGSPGFGEELDSSTTVTAGDGENTAIVYWGSNLLTGSDLDRVTFRITGISVNSSATLTPGTVSVTASMYPIGDGLDDDDGVITSEFPRYSAAEVGTATVVSIVPANTTLLIPFAVSAGAYDTGIALANTSADPFGAATGGATPQAGTVRMDLYPSTATGAGTAANFTTSATRKAGGGIAADGTIPPGATWTVNLSELLPLAGTTGSFTGYIFVQANFLYAHGAAYIYDGRGFTSSTPVLVMPPPAIAGRVGIGDPSAETLAF